MSRVRRVIVDWLEGVFSGARAGSAPEPARPSRRKRHDAFDQEPPSLGPIAAATPRRPGGSTRTCWGCRLAHVVSADIVPSTGEYSPYVHIFFEMADGSYVAFFDLGDGEITRRDPGTPRWVNHLALEVENEEALETAKARLEAGRRRRARRDRPRLRQVDLLLRPQ